MSKKPEKTNVMRTLETLGISYKAYEYDNTLTDGAHVATSLGKDPSCVFKTLVTVGHDRKNYVFVVPVTGSLDLKAAAASVGVKNVEMIPQKQLLPLTGYIHGGCSPIGMKKKFVTVIDESAKDKETIVFSAGKVGHQVETSPLDLANAVQAKFAKIASV